MLERVSPYYVDILVFSTLVTALFIVGYFTVPLIRQFSQTPESSMLSLSENILQGTLALGALALTVLGYCFSQIQRGQSTKERAPYKRISYIMFFVASLSMIDATTSAVFLLTKDSDSFLTSLIILYLIVVGQIVSVSLWVRKELKGEY